MDIKWDGIITISGCRVAATHLAWDQDHGGSIPSFRTRLNVTAACVKRS